jgi:hypothetical protein
LGQPGCRQGRFGVRGIFPSNKEQPAPVVSGFLENQNNAYVAGDCQRVMELNRPIYQFCRALGQNGRILPNPILRPSI